VSVILGLETLLSQQIDRVAGKRLGLIASPSSIDKNLTSVVERLHQHPKVNLAALFGPEHGLRGDMQAGETVETYTDQRTGLPVYSLYGTTKKPTPEMLADLDALVIDLQDGGVRFYTYLATLACAMEGAAEQGLPVLVLDRPTPIGGTIIEGPVLDPAYTSFVGPYSIPIRYGMTNGEIAQLFNQAFGIGCDLTVVPMQGWRRDMWFDQTGLPFVAPSPNLPTLDALTVYPGTCLVEGTNLSEGRGTTKPFEYLGAPWLDAESLADELNALSMPGVRFRPAHFVPTFSKHKGEVCRGVQVHATDRIQFRPVEVALRLLAHVKAAYPGDFAWLEPLSPGGQRSIDLLSGGCSVREHLDASKPVLDLIDGWQDELNTFAALRDEYLIYPA
jgi:uncharacterized protein YbbC (DUF1343 family)